MMNDEYSAPNRGAKNSSFIINFPLFKTNLTNMTTLNYSHIGILILIILASGIMGGLANYFLDRKERGWVGYDVLKSALLGIVAAAVVPLFLKIVSSSLMKDAEADPLQYFVFCGFCLVAAAFSTRFLQGIGDKVLQELQEVKQSNAELQATTEEVKKEQEALKDTTNTILLSGSDDQAEAPAQDAAAPEPEASEFESFSEGSERSAKSRSGAKRAAAKRPEDLLLEKFKDPKYRFRTLDGLVKATGLDEQTISDHVVKWEQEGKLKKIKRPDGIFVWTMI